MLAIDRPCAARRFAIVATLIGNLATGCGSGSNDPDGEFRDGVASGVGVVADGCGLTASVGSGAVIAAGASNVVVTVAHTIKGATSVTVIDVDGIEHRARVIAFDKDTDLAALDAPSLDVSALTLTDRANAVGPGSILTWGPEDGMEQTPVEITKRLLVTIEDIYVDASGTRGALEIAGPVTGGDSGGAVLDAEGDVTGIIYANSRGRERVGFATDQSELAELLASITGEVVDNGTCF